MGLDKYKAFGDTCFTLSCLIHLDRVLYETESFEETNLFSVLAELANDLDIKLNSFLRVLRVAITGKEVSPPLYGTLHILGKEESLKRIAKAIDVMLVLFNTQLKGLEE